MQKSWFIILAILLAGVAFSVVAITATKTAPEGIESTPNPDATENTENPDTESMTMLAGSDAIFINDQLPGTTVKVNTVVFQSAGYVVVHKSTEGKPGEVIGNSDLIETGDNIEFQIDQAIVDGQEYWAMLHSDDGDKQFEFPGSDMPITDDRGNPIMMQFVGNKDADETPEVMF